MCVCVLKRSKNNDPLSDDGDEMGKGPEEVVFREGRKEMEFGFYRSWEVGVGEVDVFLSLVFNSTILVSIINLNLNTYFAFLCCIL